MIFDMLLIIVSFHKNEEQKFVFKKDILINIPLINRFNQFQLQIKVISS